jgi:hypothetical protein
VAGGVADDEPPHAAVADEDVRAEAEDEVRYVGLARRENGVCEVVGARGSIQQVRRTPDPERGVRSERLAPNEPPRVQAGGQCVERAARGAGR